ncbi:MAG: methylated-DNA--[protein]-cysteine S-methyltransferase [Clostridia bacterium]|nr:methylated-DNA--[protein]-cysteine S-methyltransferase [Clostridia bacterium]
MRHAIFVESPIGMLQLAEKDGELTHLLFTWESPYRKTSFTYNGEKTVPIIQKIRGKVEYAEVEETPVLAEAKKQLQEYFAGERKVFELPLAPEGTDFQCKCWEGLRTIPYGETRDYKYIATYAGNPAACRAAGGANHNNPISIIVPCHRVVGSNGTLTGFGGGLDAKAYLLNLEQKGSGGEKVWQAK